MSWSELTRLVVDHAAGALWAITRAALIWGFLGIVFSGIAYRVARRRGALDVPGGGRWPRIAVALVLALVTVPAFAMMGVVTALHWPAGVVFAIVWLGALFGTKYSSVGGMAAAISAPVAMGVMGRIDLLPVTLALALIVLWRHRENIGRLAKGTESKVGGSKLKVAEK